MTIRPYAYALFEFILKHRVAAVCLFRRIMYINLMDQTISKCLQKFAGPWFH
jgi:hypothetical protein